MEKDLQKKGYFYDPERFADLINGVMCSGRQRKDITRPEFLSGFAKDSRLSPCVTVVLYYGNGWDGATNLYEILDFSDIPKELKDKVNNYKIYLCAVREFKNTDVFHTDLKQVFDCIRYSEEPEKLYELVLNDPTYREMNGDTYDLIAQHIKTNELMQVKRYEKKEGKVDMCGAIAGLIERGRQEGIEQGIKALVETSVEFGSTKEETINRIIKKMCISNEAAELYVKKYW